MSEVSVLAPILNATHNALVFGRRVRVIAGHLAAAIPGPGTVLDLGCGDGSIAARLVQLRADLKVEGTDVLLRPQTHIPVTLYDGKILPFESLSFDYVTIVDVLHHTVDPVEVMLEAVRVARKGIVIKDHLVEGLFARETLRVMDWVGNRGHGVVLPYNYLSRAQWTAAFAHAGLSETHRSERLALYPQPFSLLFDRGLHFVAYLVPSQRAVASHRTP